MNDSWISSSPTEAVHPGELSVLDGVTVPPTLRSSQQLSFHQFGRAGQREDEGEQRAEQANSVQESRIEGALQLPSIRAILSRNAIRANQPADGFRFGSNYC